MTTLILLGVFLVLAYFFSYEVRRRFNRNGFIRFDPKAYFIAVCEELVEFTFAHEGLNGGHKTSRD